MLAAPKTEEKQKFIAAERFCNFDNKYPGTSTDSRSLYRAEDYDKSGPAGVSRRLLFKPMFEFFNQDKLLPLRFCSIQVEFELLNNFMDAIIKRDDNKSDLWNTSEIQCKCDLLALNNSLNNEYAFHLLPIILYLFISPHGIIPTNRPVMMKTPVLTSIGHHLVLNLYLLFVTLLKVFNAKNLMIYFPRLLSS